MPFDEITEASLKELCENRADETQTLDFKRALPSKNDRDKHEFLKDVSAMANASGGDLLYGIAEQDGCASSIVAITGEAADAALRRLGQVLDGGIEPRVAVVQMRTIDVEGGYVVLVRVPMSFNGPHRYLFNGHSKFMVRNMTHTSELTYGQLRDAFSRVGLLAEKAEQFRQARLDAIKARRSGRPMIPGPVCVAHLVPLATIQPKRAVDLSKISASDFALFDQMSPSSTYNLDGFNAFFEHGAQQGELVAYTQVFRFGAVECTRHGGMLARPQEKRIPSRDVTTFFRDALTMSARVGRKLELNGPAVFAISLLNVEGYEFGSHGTFYTQGGRFSDRPDLHLPEVWLDDIGASFDIDQQIKPTLDILWQAFGLPRCLEYEVDGTWRPRQ